MDYLKDSSFYIHLGIQRFVTELKKLVRTRIVPEIIEKDSENVIKLRIKKYLLKHQIKQ